MPSQPLPIEQSDRPPLRDSTNHPRSRQTSSSSSTQQASKPLRRKRSVRFSSSRRAYTSNSDPSEHSSIFDALLCSPQRSPEHTEIGDGGHSPHTAAQNDQVFITGGRSSSAQEHDGLRYPHGATGHVVYPTIAPPLRSLHIPTPLSTITEQPSSATLRPSRKASLLTLLSHRPSAPQLVHKLKSQHKKRSFSDIVPLSGIQTNGTSSTTSSLTHLSPDDIARYPSQPLAPAPPTRSPTPPGLPTFNTVAAANYRLPPPQLGLRDLFRLTSTPEEDEYRRQTVGLPRGVVMRGDRGVLVRGRWKPDRSAHTGAVGHSPAMTVRQAAMSEGLQLQGFTRQEAIDIVLSPRMATAAMDAIGPLSDMTPGQVALSANLQLRGFTRHEADTAASFSRSNMNTNGRATGRIADQTPSIPCTRTWWRWSFRSEGIDRSPTLLPPLPELRARRFQHLFPHPPPPPEAPTQTDPHLSPSNTMQPEAGSSEPSFCFYPRSPPRRLSRMRDTAAAGDPSIGRGVKKQSGWKNVLDTLCLVCCEAEKSEEDGRYHSCATNNVQLDQVAGDRMGRTR